MNDDKPQPKWHAQEVHDAHAAAIGRMAIAWNEFQESLGEIFANLFGKQRAAEALAAWHALENDRAQREMLGAVAQQKLRRRHRGYDEICWLIDTANRKLADHRNDGIHTPLMVFTDLTTDSVARILPNMMFGHMRAKKLWGKDLLKEFETYATRIRQMTTFAIAIGAKIRKPSSMRGWPKRPTLN